MEAFTYVWHNHSNGCRYIGYHLGDENDGYACSSKSERFWNDFNDPDMVWTRQIILRGTAVECLRREQEILREVDLRDNEWYNNARGAEVIFTDEVREKIRQHHLGKSSGMLGKNHSQAAKDKMSRTRKGIPLSEEHKQNLRKPRIHTENMKYPKSEETKAKMSAAKKEQARQWRIDRFGTADVTRYQIWKMRVKGTACVRDT
jgi:NUMOD3 motif-containing protein